LSGNIPVGLKWSLGSHFLLLSCMIDNCRDVSFSVEREESCFEPFSLGANCW